LTHVVSAISDSVKVTFLEEINFKKQSLFGALTPQVTKQSKKKAWQEICTTAASLEIVAKKAGVLSFLNLILYTQSIISLHFVL
jgi:hypothetical protein